MTETRYQTPAPPQQIAAFRLGRLSGLAPWHSYDTWPEDAYKLAGGANAWAGVTVDPALAMVFAATRSASFDFYGTTRRGDNLFADAVLALERAHRQACVFRAFDELTGTLLWETTLPAAGNATPSIYMIDGREYVVIACGGGKNGAPSGSSVVAFALP